MIMWLQHHLLPCAWKSLLGLDCPLCGFQRSLVALLQGRLSESWALYPPLVPVLLLLAGWAVYGVNRQWIGKKITVTASWVVLGLVMLNYLVKLTVYGIHGHA